MQQLVRLEADVLEILQKFEDRAFVHPYIRFAGGHEVETLELPRVNMAFTRKCGRWMSRDYRGYCLAEVQKLGDTLIDFDSYLVLQKVDPKAVEYPNTWFLGSPNHCFSIGVI